LTLRTELSPPPRDLESLGILNREDLESDHDFTPTKIHTCFTGLKSVTRLLIRHARNFCRLRYGKALLHMFVKKPRVALKSILRAAKGTQIHLPFPQISP
jgi:hypothetical protein